MTMRIVDTRRKAELLSLRWIEGTLRVDRGSRRRQAHLSQESENGIRGWAHPLAASKTAGTSALPKRFVEAAFKETIAVLLAPREEAASPTRGQKEFQETELRS